MKYVSLVTTALFGGLLAVSSFSVVSCVGDDPAPSTAASSSSGEASSSGTTSSSGQASSSGGSSGTSSSGGSSSGSSGDGGADADAGDPAPHVPVVGNYIKASVAKASLSFGNDVALSADGNTLAVAAPLDKSGGTGPNGGSEADTSIDQAGSVYIYTRATGGTWAKVAYLKSSDTPGAIVNFGSSISLSADGYTLAVGAKGHDGTALNSGAAYVFHRNNTSGSSWSQQGGPIKASNAMAEGGFGNAIALSGDGLTMAVGSFSESSVDTGISTGAGGAPNGGYAFAGAVYIFAYNAGNGTWSQTHYVKASNNMPGLRFGWSVALNANGTVLASSAAFDASNATGVSASASTDTSAPQAGAVFLFEKSGSSWSQTTYVKPSNTLGGMRFGSSVSLAGDGTTLAVGAEFEKSAGKGVNPTNPGPTDVSANGAGAAYVFKKSGTTWTQTYIKASNTRAGADFGRSVRLSTDGRYLVVGSPAESSAALGVNGTTPNQDDTSIANAGSAYAYGFANGTWSQVAYLKASGIARANNFGLATAITTSNNGFTLAVGAPTNPSSDVNVDGALNDTGANGSGAVYTFK